MIGGEVSAKGLNELPDHSEEHGVFFYTNVKIEIKCFCFGYFYQKLLLNPEKSSIVNELLPLERQIWKVDQSVLRCISVEPYIPILDKFFKDVMNLYPGAFFSAS